MPLPSRESIDAVLAKNLVAARHATGLTQHELARKSRVSRATIAQLETGCSDPRISTIVCLAEALGIWPFLLICGDREVGALVDFPRWLKENPVQLPVRELERIGRLLQSGMLKDRSRAVRLGAALAASAGWTGPLERTAAAVLTAMNPELGPLLGIALASKLQE